MSAPDSAQREGFVRDLRKARSVALPADPAARWVLLALLRHLKRQTWVGRVVEDRLGGKVAEISRLGALRHPHGIPDHGRVPELAQWSYSFHGVGCCLTHDDGTCVDVDFVDGGASWIDPYFYREFLASLPAPELVEARLARPEPLSGHWEANLPTLRDVGLIELRNHLKVTEQGVKVARFMEDALQAIEQAESPWSAASIAVTLDDPELAVELLKENAPDELRAMAADHRQKRRRWLIERLHDEFAGPRLQALAELGRDDAEPVVLEQLAREPVDATVNKALELVGLWSDERHASTVLKVVKRAKGEGAAASFTRTHAAAVALRLLRPETISSEQRAELLDALALPAHASDGEAGFLLALLDLDRGIARLHATVRSGAPFARQGAGCALRLMGLEVALPDDEPIDGLLFEEFAKHFAALKQRWFGAPRTPTAAE